MTRTTEYRGYQIHMELVGASKDMFDLWFCIEGPIQPPRHRGNRQAYQSPRWSLLTTLGAFDWRVGRAGSDRRHPRC